MSKGINTNFIDQEISPAEDFYHFVNGGWLRNTEIPADRASWGSFHELAKDTDDKVLRIMEEELKQPGPSSNIAARLFESGMDTSRIEMAELIGVRASMEEVLQAKTHDQLAAQIFKLITKGLSSFISLSVHPDLGNSKVYTAYLEPSMLILPERDYYLNDDDKSIAIREKYRHYVSFLCEQGKGFMAYEPGPITDQIMSIETELARHMMTKEDRRQIDKLYNPYTFEQLSNKFPQWKWEELFTTMGMDTPATVIVTDPAYLKAAGDWFYDAELDILKTYALLMIMHHAAPYAHDNMESAHFDLFFKTLEGIEKMRPRQERIIKVVNQLLGEALGRLFVKKHFPPAAKETALEMVSDIVTAFRNRIQKLSWMSETTKAYALEKLNAFTVKIGYPEKWKSYEGLEIKGSGEGGSYLENIVAAIEWKFREDADRIGKEVDKEEWFMAPQIVNAYYNPVFNEIVFPAAILQPPFFDWEADAAVNYGGIGAVIGHEITHGFDDQGSRFDKEGNFNEWWTEEDKNRFHSLTARLVEQFDAYTPFEDLALNGTFTLGENIADLGGLSVALDALALYYERHEKPGLIDGFTQEQRFFISWATVWRTKIRDEALRNQIKTDPHPPGLYRAVAPASNLDSFYRAFDIVSSSPWYRKKEDRIRIW